MLKLVFGCGYLGRRVCRLWRAAGHEVAVVTRSPAKAAELAAEGYRAIVAEVTDPASLRELPQAETVLYAVGCDRVEGGASIEDVYAGGLRNVLDALSHVERPSQAVPNHGLGRPCYIYISSTGVYGQTEGDWVDETTPCHPTREGGKACLAAERVLREHPLGERSIILRLAGIYGPDRIPRAADLIAGKPIAAPAEGYLNLIHVDDAARIVVAAVEREIGLPALYCVSDGQPAIRRDYYQQLARLLHAPSPTFTAPEPASPAAQRAASDKRVSNRRLMAEIPVELQYPSFREGLAAIVRNSSSPASGPISSPASGRGRPFLEALPPGALEAEPPERFVPGQRPGTRVGTRMSLESAIRDRTALVGILGLGYVGLPLARAFLEAGYRVLGFDIDPAKVAKLQGGESYIGSLSSDLVAAWRAGGRFEATTEPQRLTEPEALLICVPTPLAENRDPDLSYVEATARQIAATLRPGQLVVLESTTYPGTTRDIVLPLLAGSGLTVGHDFFLAYSPEREDPGNPTHTASRIPKVVGGIDETSAALADLLYSQAVVKTVRVSSCEVAEAAKILENTYRAVNIALVNELKLLFDRMGINIWEVIDAAKTKPFGFQAFYPGPGLGGHCIPIDPFYLSWIARQHGMPTRFIELAGEINTAMPGHVVERLAAALAELGKELRGSRVAVIGVAYKKDVDDPRESPAFRLLELLAERGVLLSYHDPYIPRLPTMRHYRTPDLASEPLTAEYLAAQDAVLIVTDHSCIDWAFLVEHSRLVIDTRNATRAVVAGREKIRLA